MSTPATQSNNALGRRSSPSSFFAPLQTLSKYMDSRKDDSHRDDRQKERGSDSAEELAGIQRTGLPDGLELLNARDPMNDDAGGAAIWSDDRASTGPLWAIQSSDDPDPEAVRGAISRLARGAEWPSVAPSSQAESAAPPSGTAGFADVARRVWSRSAEEPASPYLADAARTEVARTDMARTNVESVEAKIVTMPSTALPASAISGSTMRSSPTAALESVQGGVRGSRLRSNLDSSLSPPLDESPNCAEAYALAHDASNLLGALRLYSELLCFSGVLHERHRHYAEDLKLLSLRSEHLIARLLQLAEQVAAAECERIADPAAARSEASSADQMLASHAGPELSEAAFVNQIANQTPNGTASCTVNHSESQSGDTSLADILMRVRGLLGTIARGALVVDLDTTAALPVDVPAEALERVLVNLVSNAATAIRDGGAIRICAGMAGGPERSSADACSDSALDSTVVLTVDDSGCGMNESQLRCALGLQSPAAALSGFAPASRRHGLGLSIVRELVASHGGELFMQSRPGTGTRIEIHWPTRPAAVQHINAVSEEASDGWKRIATWHGQGLSPVPRTLPRPSNRWTAQAGLQQPEFVPTVQGAVA